MYKQNLLTHLGNKGRNMLFLLSSSQPDRNTGNDRKTSIILSTQQPYGLNLLYNNSLDKELPPQKRTKKCNGLTTLKYF